MVDIEMNEGKEEFWRGIRAGWDWHVGESPSKQRAKNGLMSN
jgi:hypothetical protein